MKSAVSFQEVLKLWQKAWPEAIADWSRYVQLREPTWCCNPTEEKQAHLSGSFAMIRLVDHTVIISLAQIVERELQGFAHEILSHEIGHHVYCPADLTDNARLLARVRRGLPTCEDLAPLVANLYADLLINDRLQRHCGRNIAGIYQRLKPQGNSGKLWQIYMRMYELLWNLPPTTLVTGNYDSRLNQDALLGSRVIRNYSRDWLAGAGRFACLLFPYIEESVDQARKSLAGWGDTICAGAGAIPDGLAEIDLDELDGIIHPAEDPQLSGMEPQEREGQALGSQRVPSELSGRKTLKSFRSPFEYAELLKASGVELNPREIVVRYYRERALPYLIPFPAQVRRQATDPHPEGLDLWDIGQDIQEIDWVGTLTTSPQVIPGVTTRTRLYANAPGNEPQREPMNLYLGIDCSGSMGDPAYQISYPVLAGTIIALSALRAGAFVKVVLSGEPGNSISTEGFIRSQVEILTLLLNYLGTGYAFGIHRLEETFGPDQLHQRPTHLLIVSDYDMFTMLHETGNQRLGWDVAREAIERCGGGGTYVLQLPGFESNIKNQHTKDIQRMRDDGWQVHLVNSMEELVGFAAAFSKYRYSTSAYKK